MHSTNGSSKVLAGAQTHGSAKGPDSADAQASGSGTEASSLSLSGPGSSGAGSSGSSGSGTPSVRGLSLSVVVPTYREVENLPALLGRLDQVRSDHDLDLEVLIVDDDSRDGTVELVQRMAIPWVRLVVRTEDRGLSQAVLEGLRLASGSFLLVMDADLSHPPERIPEMLAALQQGADFVIGSRFVEGGSTDDDWGVFRWLNSRIATLFAMPLVHVKDPMSGFFALPRGVFEKSDPLNPIGYKIGLELLVKGKCQYVREVPIHFQDRRLGQSKLSMREQLRYLQHVRRLYQYKFGGFTSFVQFAVVGFLGMVLNLLLLTLFVAASLPMRLSVGLAILLSMLCNFVLNRRFSFSYARHESALRQLTRFVSACSAGAVVNYFVTLALLDRVSFPQLAAIVGILAGLAFNFLASRYWVFRVRHVRKEPESGQVVDRHTP